MVRTIISLPEDLAAAVDQRAPRAGDRDELVAAALRVYLALPRRAEGAGDLAIINAHAAELNAEAEDALAYQVPFETRRRLSREASLVTRVSQRGWVDGWMGRR